MSKTKTDPNAPAMPCEEKVLQRGMHYADQLWIHVKRPGLTKREAFVKAAMQGLCCDYGRFRSDEELAEAARNIADAQIAALNEEEASTADELEREIAGEQEVIDA